MYKDAGFYEIWSYNTSERQTIKISLMIHSNQNNFDSALNEIYIKSFYDDEDEYNLRKLQRDNKAKLNQKFYFNALIDYNNGKSFRTKGFSLYRNQIPNLINILTKIVNGDFDKNLEGFEKNHLMNNSKNNSSQYSETMSFGTPKRDTNRHSPRPKKIVRKQEQLTDEELSVRKKFQLSEKEFIKYVNDIKNTSKKKN